MIAELREAFNREYSAKKYEALLDMLEERCGCRVEFRVAETPIFLERALLERMAKLGADMTCELIADPVYMEAAQRAIPAEYRVAGQCRHPHFLTADFALVREAGGELTPRLVEIQAFPSVYAYQAVLNRSYLQAYGLDDKRFGWYLSGLDRDGFWELLSRTVLGGQDPMYVALTEIDPEHQKTRPDFEITAKRLGIAVVDIRRLEAEGNKLHYRNAQGKLIPIHRIYNRAIADELIARNVKLPFDLTKKWDVEWAGHPNWYFLISKFSLPWLTRKGGWDRVVPPAVFLDEFLNGDGRQRLEAAGVKLPAAGPDALYSELLLKPLFSFAGKGIEFEPTQARLEAIPADERKGYLLQQRMRFEPTIETPFGMTQAEIRILYLWPDRGTLRAALPLVRLGRGKMMGVDHNKNQEWVGGSAAFYPKGRE
ncbi:hypothetical protein [Occallatibacter riparius]|uniref:Circularly permuted type 2 ATP-grasp protein n=1 Tax=Occallatibacter riparius TaxID=1002689 RepID=A0A9J7BW93_9BACT|nr:hypothetical protein [Occallatibacter riparius]UWZ86904.1 hypothetical protein MOP44_13365 [Occallatibacter riparius]